jgi:hypothetical protein
MHTAERGTGRTTRQLKYLKKGGLYVVHSTQMREHAYALLYTFRDDIEVITLDQVMRNTARFFFNIKNHYPDFDIDHAVLDKTTLVDRRDVALLRELADRVRPFRPDAAYFLHEHSST